MKRFLTSPQVSVATTVLGQMVAVVRLLMVVAWITDNKRKLRPSKLSVAISVASVLLNAARLYEARRIGQRGA
jgi:hypothetical protein